MKLQFFAKYASMISRGSNRFFDRELAPFGIGCGQQFFLALIAEHEDISMYGLAALGLFDKGTVTKAVQKLEELHYITCEVDADDRRIRRLRVTEAALPVLECLRQCKSEWNAVLTHGLSEEEIELAEKLLAKIARNANESRTEGEKGHAKSNNTQARRNGESAGV